MKLADIAQQFQLELRGDGDVDITGIAGLEEAGPGQLSFLFNPAYRDVLSTSQAAAVVLRSKDLELTDKPALISQSPRLTWAKVAGLFDPRPTGMPVVDKRAIISDLATVGKGVAVGAEPLSNQAPSSRTVRGSVQDVSSEKVPSSVLVQSYMPTLPCITTCELGSTALCIAAP